MNTFEASVAIHLINNASGGLAAIASSMTKTQAAADALNARMKAISGVFNSGLIMAAGGAALAAPLIFATKAAMDLQTAMGRVQIATGASNAQMAQLNDTLTTTANVTGIFSKPKLASFAADMYSTGITQMKQINELLPVFAQGADLMKILSHGKISPEEAAHTFSAMAHQFGRYDSASMAPIVNAAVATAPSLPGGLAALRGMGGYVNVMGNRTLGIDPVRLIALESTLNQVSGSSGAGGRGGLSGAMLIAGLKRVMPGVFGAGLLSGKSAFSAEVMGLAHGGVSSVFTDGKMDLDKLFKVLINFEAQSGTQIAKKMLAHTSMLGKKGPEEEKFLHNFLKDPKAPKAQLVMSLLTSQAGTAGNILQLLGDPKFQTQLKATEDRIKAFKGIQAMQAQAMKMLEPQLYRLQTNFMTLASTIGTHMIPVLTPLVTKMGDILDKMNTFAEKHPKIVQTVISLTAAASALLLIGGAVQVMRAGFMGLKLLTFAGPIGSILGKLGPLFAKLSPLLSRFGFSLVAALGPEILLPIIAVIAGVALVVANWGNIMKFVHKNSGVFIHAMAEIERWIKKLGLGFQQFGNNLAALWEQIGIFLGSSLLGKIVSQAGHGAAASAAGAAGAAVTDTAREIQANAMAARNAAIRAMTPSKEQLERDKKLIGAGAVNAFTGASAAKPVIVNQTNNITMQQVPGHDHDKCAKNLTKRVAQGISAGSGSSTGRSINQGGTGRPN